MTGFITQSGTKYILDQDKKEFYGGNILKTPYIRAQAIIGCPAIIALKDDRIVKTSVVVKYI